MSCRNTEHKTSEVKLCWFCFEQGGLTLICFAVATLTSVSEKSASIDIKALTEVYFSDTGDTMQVYCEFSVLLCRFSSCHSSTCLTFFVLICWKFSTTSLHWCNVLLPPKGRDFFLFFSFSLLLTFHCLLFDLPRENFNSRMNSNDLMKNKL